MAANTTAAMESIEMFGCKICPTDFVRFFYDAELRIGVVEKITEKNLIVKTDDKGFRSFNIAKMKKENHPITSRKFEWRSA